MELIESVTEAVRGAGPGRVVVCCWTWRQGSREPRDELLRGLCLWAWATDHALPPPRGKGLGDCRWVPGRVLRLDWLWVFPASPLFLSWAQVVLRMTRTSMADTLGGVLLGGLLISLSLSNLQGRLHCFTPLLDLPLFSGLSRADSDFGKTETSAASGGTYFNCLGFTGIPQPLARVAPIWHHVLEHTAFSRSPLSSNGEWEWVFNIPRPLFGSWGRPSASIHYRGGGRKQHGTWQASLSNCISLA